MIDSPTDNSAAPTSSTSTKNKGNKSGKKGGTKAVKSAKSSLDSKTGSSKADDKSKESSNSSKSTKIEEKDEPESESIKVNSTYNPTKNSSSSPTTSKPSTSPTTAKPSTNRPTYAKSHKSNNIELELANLSNGAEKQSNKAAVLWSMFVLAALGALVAALIVHRKSRRRQRKRRQWGEVSDHGLHSDNGDLEEQHSEELYVQCMDRYEAGEEPTHNYPSPRTERGFSTPRTQAPPVPLSTVTEMRSCRELNQALANQTMMSLPTRSPEEANLQGIILRDRNNNGIPSRFVKRDVMAPSGKVGIVIKSSLMGCMIHSVKEGSPMEGHLYDGDIIILFNDEDVTGCTARQLTMMIAETSDVTKKFTVLSNTGPVRF